MQGAFDAFAMGNFPFPTDYMTGEGQGELPAWPMRAACDCMSSLAPSSPGQASSPTNKADTNPVTTVAAGQHLSHRQAGAHALISGRKGLHEDHTAAASNTGNQAELVNVGSIDSTAVKQDGAPDLLGRLAAAASILYNASGTASCFSLDLSGPAAGSVGAWDYQVRGLLVCDQRGLQALGVFSYLYAWLHAGRALSA
jgi:hypothetical protein